MNELIDDLRNAFNSVCPDGMVSLRASQTTGKRIFRECNSEIVDNIVADSGIEIRFAVIASADTGVAGAECVIRNDADGAFFRSLRAVQAHLTEDEARGLFFLEGRNEQGNKNNNYRITRIVLGWNASNYSAHETSKECHIALLSLASSVVKLINARQG